ncbi:MAG: hypothetical protein RLO81_00850 [Fulvivirga sp.]|uniref:hypothetical protein n=1 Tax=Fulvivirga sp. TaxID=1931237 RepID=UPI0032EE5F3C
MTGFYSTYIEIIESIENAIKDEKIITALILLFSAIDSFSNLVNREKARGRNVFIKWTEEWMLKNTSIECSSVDLYAARCGILHGFISESDLSNKKEAKQILYAFGEVPLDSLKDIISITNRKKECVAVKLEDLFLAFRQGISNCYLELNNDPNWLKQFEEKAAKYFVTMKK